MKTLAIFAAVLALISNAESATDRRLMLVGGALADDNEELYGKFVDLSGGKGSAKIGVVTGASSDPSGRAEFYLQHFLDFGAVESYWVPVYIGNEGAAIDPEVVEKVSC